MFSLSHRTCGLSALGGVIAGGDVARLHASLASAGIGSIILSTCNRFEVYWHSTSAADDDIVVAAIAAALPLAGSLLEHGSVQAGGDAAARHLFRVCSGLESMVLGEAEILGQARVAMEQSSGAGSFLRGVFTAAIRTGRTARAETGIGVGAMSVASAAIEQLESQLPLGSSRVLLIGAGETAAKAARQLVGVGVGQLVIANRTPERAAELAALFSGVAVPFDTIADEIAKADAVVCAAHSPTFLINRTQIEGRQKPVVLVDLSMPPVIEPCEVPGVTRIDLQWLERATAAHRQRREAEVPRVEHIIARELDWLRGWARHDRLRPLVSTLRQKADSIRRAELERARLELVTDDPHRVLERFSRRVFDRILAVPVEQLKSGDVPIDEASVEYLRRLFALGEVSSMPLQDAASDTTPLLRRANTEGES
ncbi:MAG TPA: glutamyl-tRNA reductase [Vicinamibacterales bacterium]|nr:glutamyl-tRNA reductase [Vicinamibacterales bacterium]